MQHIADQILTLPASETVCGDAAPTATVLNAADWLGQRVKYGDEPGTIIGVTSTFTVALRLDNGACIITAHPSTFTFLPREP